MNRNLRNQMRRISKTVKAEALCAAGFSVRAVAEHSRAKQRRDLGIFVFVRQMKAVSRVDDGEFSVAAVDVVAGKLGVIAKIFTVRSTISAIAIGPAEPRNSNAISDFELRIADCGLRIRPGADLIDATDNLMTKHELQPRIGEFALNN